MNRANTCRQFAMTQRTVYAPPHRARIVEHYEVASMTSSPGWSSKSSIIGQLKALKTPLNKLAKAVVTVPWNKTSGTSLYLYRLPLFLTSISWKGAAAIRVLPSGVFDRRRGDSNPRPSCPKTTTLSVWPSLIERKRHRGGCSSHSYSQRERRGSDVPTAGFLTSDHYSSFFFSAIPTIITWTRAIIDNSNKTFWEDFRCYSWNPHFQRGC